MWPREAARKILFDQRQLLAPPPWGRELLGQLGHVVRRETWRQATEGPQDAVSSSWGPSDFVP